jgi:hypothetical protein
VFGDEGSKQFIGSTVALIGGAGILPAICPVRHKLQKTPAGRRRHSASCINPPECLGNCPDLAIQLAL